MISEDTRNEFELIAKALEQQSEAYWNTLTKEQQLDTFCAVVRRIYKGDVELGGSYRYVLYEIFEFGPEAYMPAQLAGYLTIHNMLWDNRANENN